MGILVLVIVLVVAVVLFSVQNAAPVAVTFLFWGFDASLAVVIFLALVSGIVLGSAITLWSRRRPKEEQHRANNTAPRDPDPSGTAGF